MIQEASVNDTAVFKDIPSPLKKYVNAVNIIIPETNDTNLPGQNCPSNPLTVNLVASIKIYVIGMPNSNSNNLYFLAQGHTNGPLICIQTIP